MKTLLILLTLFTSCINPDSVESKRIADDYFQEIKIDSIIFDFDYIIEFGYDSTTNDFFIYYMDGDVFDIDNIQYLYDYPGDNLKVYLSKRTFFSLLNDFNKPWEERLELVFDHKYVLLQIRTPDPSVKYYLIESE